MQRALYGAYADVSLAFTGNRMLIAFRWAGNTQFAGGSFVDGFLDRIALRWMSTDVVVGRTDWDYARSIKLEKFYCCPTHCSLADDAQSIGGPNKVFRPIVLPWVEERHLFPEQWVNCS